MAKRLLGMGDLRFAFTTPNRYDAVIMPEQLFFIEDSEAVLDGRDLGEPVRLDENPTIVRYFRDVGCQGQCGNQIVPQLLDGRAAPQPMKRRQRRIDELIINWDIILRGY